MATYLMFGKYTSAAAKGISADRTAKASDLVKQLGGQVKEIYALLGEHDLLLVVDLPDTATAMKASIALLEMTGVSFSSVPALPVAEFDRLVK